MDDRIERLLGPWREQRPDVDVDAMLTVARLTTVARLVSERLERGARRPDGRSAAEVEVLFALLREGPPFWATPSSLAKALLMPGGTMTSRLDRLEQQGLARRTANPDDRRSVVVELTREGQRLGADLIERHVAFERELLAPLTDRERVALDRALHRLLVALDEPPS